MGAPNHIVKLFVLLLLTGNVTGQPINLMRIVQPENVRFAGVAAEDPKGYIWFATHNGLCRYDGYRFVTYLNDPQDTNSLANNITDVICAARDGTIWIGSEISGLDRFDPITGKFTHFTHNDTDDSTLTSNKIIAIAEDRNGMIWVGTHSGLNMLDPKTKKVIRYQHDSTDETSLSHDQVRVIYEDKKGTLWIGTGSAFAENPGNFGGLNRFIPETRCFKRYVHDPKNPKTLIDNRIRVIFEDSRGVFWIGTAGDGLHTMDREKGEFTRHTFDPRHPEKLSRGPLKKVIKWAVDHITFINEDAAGYIWIGTLGNGVNRYDYRTGKMVNVADEEFAEGKIFRQSPWWSLSSKDGVLWLGYWSGTYVFDPLRTEIPFVETGYPVHCVLRDSSNIWIGTDNMLVRKNLSTHKEIHYRHDPSAPANMKNFVVRSLYEDQQGDIWMGTDNGLSKFDKRSGSFFAYRISEAGLHNNTVYSILEDRDGNKWFATVDEGLIRTDAILSPSRYYLSRYYHKAGDTNSLSRGNINCVYEDHSGNIWIGLYIGGVNKISPATGKVEHYLYGTNVNSITQDAFGILWVATQSGLYRSDTAVKNFSLYGDTYDEIPKNIRIGAIIEDDTKTLWMSSSIGILKLTPKRDRLILRTKSTGFDRHGFKTHNGQIYFGDLNGYFAFYPPELQRNGHPPRIVINEFRVGEVPQKLTNDDEIHLNHAQNTFSFQFAGIHYSDATRNRHLYMLEGVDNAWRNGGEEKMAYYNSVAPGTYIFHIKAANSDGVWAERKIKIIIDPPWWRAWWAYTLYAVLASALIWAFITFRLRNLRNQLANKDKEKQFEELRRQKSDIEMQALRAQMNPHFIFNSLNSINRFILHNNKTDASEYLSKFSRLVRLILNNSRASTIPLQNEIEALELYLELESLRFDNHFRFKITVDPDIDTAMINVPPLIIQPFAENAVWHGLMHKKESGNLEIEITKEEDVLVCKVRDDGIGRKKASELKNRSRVSHKSFGMKITASRIDLLQQQHVNGSSIVINDLVTPDNTPAGTEVVLKLPVSYA